MEEEDLSEEEDLPEEDTLSSTLSSSSSVLYSTTQSTTDTITTVTMTTARNHTPDGKPRVDDIAEKGDAENVIGNNSEEGTCVLSSDWSESNGRINAPQGPEDWKIPFVGLKNSLFFFFPIIGPTCIIFLI